MNENVVARGKREAKKVNFKKTASIIAIKPLLLLLLAVSTCSGCVTLLSCTI